MFRAGLLLIIRRYYWLLEGSGILPTASQHTKDIYQLLYIQSSTS